MNSAFPSSSPALRISADSTPDSSHLPTGRATSVARPVSKSQPALDLRNFDDSLVLFTLPLLSIDTVRQVTGRNEDEVLAEIDSGKLLWAFNLAGRNAEKQFVRIWSRSLIHWINPTLWQSDNLGFVIDAILPKPPDQPAIRCARLKESFACSSTHVLNLLRDGLLARVPEKIGPFESPAVTRASVVRLLTERRII